MMWFKGCPTCGGDLIEDHAEQPPEITCLQCARPLNGAQLLSLKARTVPIRHLGRLGVPVRVAS
jgi:hypothetical protein